MYIKNFIFILFGLFIGGAYSVSAISNLEIEQENYRAEYGFYFSDFSDPSYTISTYETICKGYYITDYTNKNKIKYIGYGDLDFKYTYEIDIPLVTNTASST